MNILQMYLYDSLQEFVDSSMFEGKRFSNARHIRQWYGWLYIALPRDYPTDDVPEQSFKIGYTYDLVRRDKQIRKDSLSVVYCWSLPSAQVFEQEVKRLFAAYTKDTGKYHRETFYNIPVQTAIPIIQLIVLITCIRKRYVPSDEFPELQPFNVIVDEKFTYEGKQDTRLPRVLNVQDTYAKILSGVTIQQRQQTHRQYLFEEIDRELTRTRWSGEDSEVDWGSSEESSEDSKTSSDGEDGSYDESGSGSGVSGEYSEVSEDDEVSGENSSVDGSVDGSGGEDSNSVSEDGGGSGGSASKVIPLKNYVMALLDGMWFPAVIVDGPPGKRRDPKEKQQYVQWLDTEFPGGIGPILIDGLNFKLEEMSEGTPFTVVLADVDRRYHPRYKHLNDGKEKLRQLREKNRNTAGEKNDAGAPSGSASLSRAVKNEPQLRL